MDIKEMANKVTIELQEDLVKKGDEVKLIQGAIQGIAYFYQKLTEVPDAEQRTPDSVELKDEKSAAPAKSKK